MRRLRRNAALAAVSTIAALLAACTATVSGSGQVAGSLRIPTGTATAPSGGRVSSPAPEPTPQPASFFDCQKFFKISALHLPASRATHLHFDCAAVSVPLDYGDPTGKQIQLAMLRVHDDATSGPRRDLLVNPGGPGASGVTLALGLAKQLPDTVLSHFDIVGFDPRGVGSSTPVRCVSDTRKDALNAASPDVLTAAGFAQAMQLATSLSKACIAKYGDSLQYFNTVDTARDMDQLRQALGQDRTDYLGFSYGTELGSVYAHLYPRNVGSMVLDGAVDPLTSGIAQDTEQLQGFERAFGQFSDWCSAHSPCKQLGDPASAVEKLTAAAGAAPIPAEGDTRRATPELVITATFGALYDQKQWPTLATALITARGGDAAGLLRIADSYNERFDGHYTNVADANETISCNDSRSEPSDRRIRSTAQAWARSYPVFGKWFATGLFGCRGWTLPRTVPPKPTAPHTARTVLVLGNLHDPATPYQGAVDMARVMAHAELLSWDGEGHTSYLNGSGCIDHYVDAYLVKGTLPPPHRTCPR
jgi:pimeloyl-ACP methyl ester carboxylesterase